MAAQKGSSSQKRSHIILIPGFGGFDALGQVEYYAGITPLFHDWRAGKPVVLHYFDNLPTAAVVTRAERLRRYLAKRFARGEIREDEEIALVGHSTGGLDIRQLLSDLHDLLDNRDNKEVVDGGREVEIQTLLKGVRRVVFLSVPQWGTNIADWVVSHSGWRQLVVANVRAAVEGSRVNLIHQIEEWMAGAAAYLTDADLLRAVQDALTEADEHDGELSPMRTAAAHEAAAELALYVRHIDSDFHVISDLTSERPAGGPTSPAHFNPDERAEELKRWDTARIESLSYVTVGGRPFRFEPSHPAPVWDLANPFSYPEWLKDRELSQGTDMAYRLCYRACAGGPFRRPDQSVDIRDLSGSPKDPKEIELWDNDGIVNTLSMLWPRGDHVLVECDHLDIVGHCTLSEADPAGGRQYWRYDALKSVPRFSGELFKQIWTEIFEFCTQ